jgi:hypothetical protein
MIDARRVVGSLSLLSLVVLLFKRGHWGVGQLLGQRKRMSFIDWNRMAVPSSFGLAPDVWLGTLPF